MRRRLPVATLDAVCTLRERMMNRISHRVLTVGVAAGVLVASAAVAGAASEPPDAVLEHAQAAVGQGQERAADMLALAATRHPETGVPDHAQGKPGHATGLERAQEAVAKAADRVRGYEKDHPGEGHAYGRGHAAEVHEALAAGILPSALESHGERVSAMVKTVQSIADEKPGRGLGRDKDSGSSDD
jgi:hypothetical protein